MIWQAVGKAVRTSGRLGDTIIQPLKPFKFEVLNAWIKQSIATLFARSTSFFTRDVGHNDSAVVAIHPALCLACLSSHVKRSM